MKLEVVHQDVRQLNEEQFAMIRRNGIGASDTAAILGAYTGFGMTVDQLIQQKINNEYTEEEAEIGKKPAVRKGKDLEAIIIEKAAKSLGKSVQKDFAMYRMVDFPCLTVNFDGRLEDGTPVEVKFCTTYGDKYYDFTKDEQSPFVSSDIFECAQYYGIPPYYYVQIQQQIMAAKTDHGYLCVLRDKDWELYVFKIHANPQVHELIQIETYKVWSKVRQLRTL
jgi:hypothetical protein